MRGSGAAAGWTTARGSGVPGAGARGGPPRRRGLGPRRRGEPRHYQAAIAHERVAEVEDRAVAEGLGDVAAHQRAADREREAARRNFMAAQQANSYDAD
ncbi:hypothetical protein [Mycobacterium avium]|uniref:hypothetical protein n=1 Tax=Mycobacterium avium TaxID=1764 RepID=UPI0012DAE1FA|nr:hypothetical protein [Mycobacterium avium]